MPLYTFSYTASTNHKSPGVAEPYLPLGEPPAEEVVVDVVKRIADYQGASSLPPPPHEGLIDQEKRRAR